MIAKNSSYDTVITIDGNEELRIGQDQLGTIGLLSSNSTSIPIYAASASKIFSLHPNQPMHFSTSFQIEIHATAGGNQLNGYMVTWREQL